MTAAFSVNKRIIAKNTMYLYIRMGLVLGVNFYAVRLLLELLGVEDYGIYNVIFGFVLLFSVLNGALTSMMNRFLCHEMGAGGRDVGSVFSVGFWFFVLLTGLLVLAAETGGLWFVRTHLNIPADRVAAGAAVYQFAILATVFKTMQIPFMSVVTSYERMGFFAKLSVVEALSILASVLLLGKIGGDRLPIFAGLYASCSGLVLLSYFLYVKIGFPEFSFRPRFNRARIGEMGSFFSYSILGAGSNLIKEQGLDVLLNMFCGVALNTTWALSRKIGNAVAQIAWNFQTAFYPQIIKSFSSGNVNAFYDLIVSTSRYSFALVWLIAMPVIFDTDLFIGLWLKGELPPLLTDFTRLLLAGFVLEAMCAPLWMAAQADGDIKRYQLMIFTIVLLGFGAACIVLRAGFGALSVPAVLLCVNILLQLYRTLYLKLRYAFPAGGYFSRAVLPAVSCVMLSYGVSLLLRHYIAPTEIGTRLAVCAMAVAVNVGVLWRIMLSRGERSKVREFAAVRLLRGGGR